MIVNGDDFGRNESANRGVIDAFARGLISSTTIMANQTGFDEAVELARAHDLDAHLGVHLVLTEGTPLTDPIRRRSRFCDEDGAFRMWEAGLRPWRFVREDRDCLVGELRAQVARVRAAGFAVTHVDSHHQVHNHWGVASCVIVVCDQLEVPYVRLARNIGPGIGVARSAYKRTFNARLRKSGHARTQWFGVASDWLHETGTESHRPGHLDVELMTHPQTDPEGRLVDTLSDTELGELLAPIPGVASATSYSGARR